MGHEAEILSNRRPAVGASLGAHSVVCVSGVCMVYGCVSSEFGDESAPCLVSRGYSLTGS